MTQKLSNKEIKLLASRKGLVNLISRHNTSIAKTIKYVKYEFELKKLQSEMIKLQNWVYDNKKNLITELNPENRFYPVTNNFTTEASIYTNLLGDLYSVLGEGNINSGWVLRSYYNPLVGGIPLIESAESQESRKIEEKDLKLREGLKEKEKLN